MSTACKCLIYCAHINRDNENFTNCYCNNPTIIMFICDDACITVISTVSYQQFWANRPLGAAEHSEILRDVEIWGIQKRLNAQQEEVYPCEDCDCQEA